jgi:uncharacterized membrane-anchored protein YitT (DUF2179 family)
MRAADPATAHRPLEDLIAGLTGTAIEALGLTLLAYATLLTGGTAGLALLLSYATSFKFGAIPVLLIALGVVAHGKVARSLVGAAVLNLVIATNHRPGRYVGVC